jgi:hypothetical protein
MPTRMKTSVVAAIATALSSICLIGSAMAGDTAAAGDTVPSSAIGVAAQVGRPASTIDGFGRSLDPVALDAYRGGDDSVANDVRIRGQVDGNTAQNTVSGDNTLTGGAFSNASGISTVIQNSGSNVLIQNGMVVNVQFAGSGP